MGMVKHPSSNPKPRGWAKIKRHIQFKTSQADTSRRSDYLYRAVISSILIAVAIASCVSMLPIFSSYWIPAGAIAGAVVFFVSSHLFRTGTILRRTFGSCCMFGIIALGINVYGFVANVGDVGLRVALTELPLSAIIAVIVVIALALVGAIVEVIIQPQ